MRLVRLSRKEYKEKFGDSEALTVKEGSKEPIMYFPEGATTETELHEEYHAKKSPSLKDNKGFSAATFALEELRAEDYVSQKTGKDIYFNTSGIAKVLLDHGYSSRTIMDAIVKALRTEGLEPLSRQERKDLWDYMEIEKSRSK